MALKLALKPNEPFVVNGARLRNGPRRTSLLLESRTRFLKGDMVPQDEVSSDPLSRIYDLAANIYLTVPEDKKALHDLRNMIMLELAPKHVQSQISASVRTAIMHAVTEADPYQALLAVFKATRHEPSWKEATAA